MKTQPYKKEEINKRTFVGGTHISEVIGAKVEVRNLKIHGMEPIKSIV